MDTMEPVIIDMGQSVLTDHFNAQTYLQRDVTNIARYFGKLNIPVNEEEMMSIIQRKEEEEK
jgi:RIO kinase 1